MSGDATLEDGAEDDPADGQDADRDVGAQLELLAEENRRLREQSRRLRRSQYRRTALGLGALGLLAGAGAALFPAVREVLLALTGIGLFSAVLIYFLMPERFVAASIGESVYSAHARSTEELVADLGLEDIQVYVPVGDRGSRLFIPQHVDYRVPDEDEFDGAIVVPDDERRRGVSLHPTGDDLVTELERTVSDELADDPAELARQLADGLVEVFELAEGASASPASVADDDPDNILPGPDSSEPEGRLTVGVTGNVYGDGAVIDHPVTSVLACGLARGIDKPVVADTATSSDPDVDYLVTFQWRAFVFE
ncbi:MAG: hypothetical protein V5A62_18420 [Haloarculaceae archaeon]